MRKYLGSLAFASCLSAASPAMAAMPPSEAATDGSVAVHRAGIALPGLRDEAAMVLVGTALIGLAAAVRRRAV